MQNVWAPRTGVVKIVGQAQVQPLRLEGCLRPTLTDYCCLPLFAQTGASAVRGQLLRAYLEGGS